MADVKPSEKARAAFLRAWNDTYPTRQAQEISAISAAYAADDVVPRAMLDEAERRYNDAIEEGAEKIADAEERAETADRALAEARAENDALEKKINALAPHGTCGCSYDKPDDLCMHHSPQVMQARAENEQLREALQSVVSSGANSYRIGGKNDDVTIARYAYEDARAALASKEDAK